METKKIIALIFIVIIYLKFIILLVWPNAFKPLINVFIKHVARVRYFYLLLAIYLGYLTFTSVALIDIPVVMLFTAVLIGAGLLFTIDDIGGFYSSIMSDMRAVMKRSALVWLVWLVSVTLIAWGLFF